MTTATATPTIPKRKEAHMKRHLPLVLAGAALALAGCATSAQPTVISGAERMRAAIEASNVRAGVVQARLTGQAITGCVDQVVAVVNVSRAHAEAGCRIRLLSTPDQG